MEMDCECWWKCDVLLMFVDWKLEFWTTKECIGGYPDIYQDYLCLPSYILCRAADVMAPRKQDRISCASPAQFYKIYSLLIDRHSGSDGAYVRAAVHVHGIK